MKFIDIFNFFFENEARGKNSLEQQPVQQHKTIEAIGNKAEEDDFDSDEMFEEFFTD